MLPKAFSLLPPNLSWSSHLATNPMLQTSIEKKPNDLSCSLHSIVSRITSISRSHCSAFHGSAIPSNLSGRSARNRSSSLSPVCLGGGGGSTIGGGTGQLFWLPKCSIRCMKASNMLVGSIPGGIGAPFLCLSVVALAI